MRCGEIRWCSIGVNVGEEIDGKGPSFVRPVVVIDMIGRRTALIVPVSTKTDIRVGYFPIEAKGEKQSAVVSNIRVVSQKR